MTKDRKKTADNRGDRRNLLPIAVVDAIAKVLQSLIKWGGICVVTYFISRFAGVTTWTNIDLNATAQIDIEQMQATRTAVPALLKWIVFSALFFGIGGVVYGHRQAKLRKDTVEHFSRLQIQWEKDIDPNRSTSGLTVRGETRPGD